jgi:PhnB protein
MSSKVSHIPKGFQSVSAVLVIHGAAQAINFYERVFGAKETMRLTEPGGKIAHAELVIGGATFSVADEFPEWGDHGPNKAGASPVRIALFVEDVDEVTKRAVAAGARMLIPVSDQFYGDRTGRLVDPFGHVWIISTHKEDVAPAEMRRRMEALSKQSK